MSSTPERRRGGGGAGCQHFPPRRSSAPLVTAHSVKHEPGRENDVALQNGKFELYFYSTTDGILRLELRVRTRESELLEDSTSTEIFSESHRTGNLHSSSSSLSLPCLLSSHLSCRLLARGVLQIPFSSLHLRPLQRFLPSFPIPPSSPRVFSSPSPPLPLSDPFRPFPASF